MLLIVDLFQPHYQQPIIFSFSSTLKAPYKIYNRLNL